MNTTEAESLALVLMSEHGLEGWTFKFDRALRRFGCCSHAKHTISLSRHLVGLNDSHHVRDTILHEIAHALLPVYENHGPAWQAKARSIGCDGERHYDETVTTAPYRWKGTCPTCGHVWGRYRRPKGRRHCGDCGSGGQGGHSLIVWQDVSAVMQ